MAQNLNSNIALRPLKGMRTDIAAQLMEPGQFLKVENMISQQDGLLRRPAFAPTAGGGSPTATGDDGTLRDLFVFYNNETLYTVALTNRNLFLVDMATGFSSPAYGGALESPVFAPASGGIIDWTIATASEGFQTVLADGTGTLKTFNGTTISEMALKTSGDLETSFTAYTSPHAVCFFENRLWIGAPTDDSPNVLVWSDLDAPDVMDETNYFVFSEVQSTISRIVSMGNLLIVYFPDAVYFGRPTNQIDLPFAFTRVDVGSIGLVGPKAVIKWDDGHYFVGRDDIYFFSATNALQRIGSTVIKQMLDPCKKLEYIYASSDPDTRSLVFGVPTTAESFDKVWYFNYKNGEWSYGDVPGTMLASIGTFQQYTWDSLAGSLTWDSHAALPYTTWDAFEASLSLKDLYLGYQAELFRSDDLAEVDFGGVPIGIVLETGDLDLNLPDTVKTFNRMSLKFDRIADRDIAYRIEYSVNRGNTYSPVYPAAETMFVRDGTDEGRINFNITGSMVRFRLTSGTTTRPYKLTEIILRGRARGLEV